MCIHRLHRPKQDSYCLDTIVYNYAKKCGVRQVLMVGKVAVQWSKISSSTVLFPFHNSTFGVSMVGFSSRDGCDTWKKVAWVRLATKGFGAQLVLSPYSNVGCKG